MQSPNPIKRLNGEIKCSTHVVGNFPNDAAIVHFIGSLILERHGKWTDQWARKMPPETMAALSDEGSVSLPVVAPQPNRPAPEMATIYMASYTTPGETIQAIDFMAPRRILLLPNSRATIDSSLPQSKAQ